MCFRCVSEDHFITDFLNLNTPGKKVHWNTEKPKTCAYISKKIYKTLENSTYEIDPQKINTSMARMYFNVEITRKHYGYISQLTNWILDSGATCNMIPDISDLISGSLVEIDKYIKFADGHFITAIQIEQVQI